MRYRGSNAESQSAYGMRHPWTASRAARIEVVLSQSEAAYIIESNQSYISRAEQTGAIDFLTLERLAAVYGKPIEHFKTPRFLETWAQRNRNEPPMYWRHSMKDWKHHFKERRWPDLRATAKELPKDGR